VKLILPLLLSLLTLALAGCDTLADTTQRVREKLGPREEPRLKVFAADQRATYAAARIAIDKMGFRFLRGGPAQGEIDAVNAIAADDSLRGARQLSLKIRLRTMADGSTTMTATLDEIIEADSRGRAGQGTSNPLRDTPLYEVLFRNVQQAVDSPKRD
jgi:uncharacterized protein with GYD domain